MGKEIDKYEMTYIIAKAVYMSKDNKLTGSQLASILNEAGFRTNQNKRYQIGERGIFSHISAAYRRMRNSKVKYASRKSDIIANVFTDQDKEFAYLK